MSEIDGKRSAALTAATIVGLLVAFSSISPAQAQEHVASVISPLIVEAEVREHFSDAPEMVEIARCESGFRQYRADGSPLWGGFGNGMIGVFQIYKQVHVTQARSLGYDLATLAGNLGYARHIYDQQGTMPWNSSAHCWRPAVATQSSSLVHPVSEQLVVGTSVADRAALLKQVQQLVELIARLEALLAAQQIAVR